MASSLPAPWRLQNPPTSHDDRNSLPWPTHQTPTDTLIIHMYVSCRVCCRSSELCNQDRKVKKEAYATSTQTQILRNLKFSEPWSSRTIEPSIVLELTASRHGRLRSETGESDQNVTIFQTNHLFLLGDQLAGGEVTFSDGRLVNRSWV